MMDGTPRLPQPEMQMQSLDPMENQLCRVCEEPAAGFHFGAFTCEGCKSFFGRFCNNQTNIPDCKNNYRCVIDKRNRTSCKACRLRKCLNVGMSKSGCRYGRRSNWFKIHCLMQKNAKSANTGPVLTALPSSPSKPTPTYPFPSPLQTASVSAFSAASLASSSGASTSSRSPSPLNTSTDSAGSSPTPSDSIASPSPFLPFLPAFAAAAGAVSPNPLQLDPLAMYRLSPLMAFHPALQQLVQQSTPSDFHEQLRLLAERRALFEASCLEAAARASGIEDSKPIDLSVK